MADQGRVASCALHADCATGRKRTAEEQSVYDEASGRVSSAQDLLDEAYRLIYTVASFGTEDGQRQVVEWIAAYREAGGRAGLPEPDDEGRSTSRSKPTVEAGGHTYQSAGMSPLVVDAANLPGRGLSCGPCSSGDSEACAAIDGSEPCGEVAGRGLSRPCGCPREQRPDYFCPVHEAEHLPIEGRTTSWPRWVFWLPGLLVIVGTVVEVAR